eukprot:scaffold42732_cov248-Skeletonema_marinoi.AAC.1
MLLSVVGGVSVMWPAVVVAFVPLRGVFGVFSWSLRRWQSGFDITTLSFVIQYPYDSLLHIL